MQREKIAPASLQSAKRQPRNDNPDTHAHLSRRADDLRHQKIRRTQIIQRTNLPQGGLPVAAVAQQPIPGEERQHEQKQHGQAQVRHAMQMPFTCHCGPDKPPRHQQDQQKFNRVEHQCRNTNRVVQILIELDGLLGKGGWNAENQKLIQHEHNRQQQINGDLQMAHEQDGKNRCHTHQRHDP